MILALDGPRAVEGLIPLVQGEETRLVDRTPPPNGGGVILPTGLIG